RPFLISDIMRPGLFSPASFDLICMFQVLDHFPDPRGVIEECFMILRPGGVILSVNHNVNALSARLMKERSPIIDIEHTYLYSPDTMRRLFTRFGFQVKEAGRVKNRYSLSYVTRLVPVPAPLKKFVLSFLDFTYLGRLPLRV